MPVEKTEISQVQDIGARLDLVRQLFNADKLEHERFDPRAISRYYTQSAIGYRSLHSTAGSIHMALNPTGAFDRAGYYGQIKRIQSITSSRDRPSSVLELGSGTGFNSLYLAKAWPNASITGIDLTPLNVKTARFKGRKQRKVTFLEGDFHHLSFDDVSFDLVFSIESICHANDLHQVLSEAFRVARPGAKLIVFDGYRQSGFAKLDKQVRLAARLAEAAMAVEQSWIIDDWLNMARRVGFRLISHQDLTHEIMPNLRRFERLARRFFESRRLGYFLQHLFPPRLIRNAVAGLLMAATTGAGAHQYSMIVLERPEEA
jgi:ubiquinone/menaquinone biosynthesis C-methylase UbiE